MKILIVDNDPGMCQLLTMAFEYAKFEVVATGSLAEVKELVLDNSFDALLMDFHLGAGESGLSMLTRFKDDGMQIPFWLVTGTPNDNDALKVLELEGCQGIIAKPFAILELITTVTTVVSA
jgi:DNA-binding response OmpR family regulator